MNDATKIIGGPAYISWDGAVIYTVSDIRVRITRESRPRTVDAFGTLDNIFLDTTVEISFRPARWADTAKLWPYLATLPGTARLFVVR
jgi:hypothetical protein